MEWVLSHMEDPDFNEPLPASSSSQAPAPQQSSQKAADPEQVSMLGAMGFTPQQVVIYMLPHNLFSPERQSFSIHWAAHRPNIKTAMQHLTSGALAFQESA